MKLVKVYGFNGSGIVERKLVQEGNMFFDFENDYELSLEELKNEGYVLNREEAYDLETE